jgi:hypothetical protein
MNHHRRFWDELLVAVDEALAAFSGARPGLVAQSPVLAKLIAKQQLVSVFDVDIVDMHKIPPIQETAEKVR